MSSSNNTERRFSTRALEEHDKDHPSLAPPHRHKLKFDSISDDKSTEVSMGGRRRGTRPSIAPAELNRKALDVTRRLSMSNNAFADLQQFLARKSIVDPKNVKYENSYRMSPAEGEEFDTGEIHEIITRVLEKMLRDKTYQPEACGKLSMDVANRINQRLKELDMPRYKYVCNVLIGQKAGQGMRVASRCLWSKETDTFTSVSFENKGLFAVAMVHGLYFE